MKAALMQEDDFAVRGRKRQHVWFPLALIGVEGRRGIFGGLMLIECPSVRAAHSVAKELNCSAHLAQVQLREMMNERKETT